MPTSRPRSPKVCERIDIPIFKRVSLLNRTRLIFLLQKVDILCSRQRRFLSQSGQIVGRSIGCIDVRFSNLMWFLKMWAKGWGFLLQERHVSLGVLTSVVRDPGSIPRATDSRQGKVHNHMPHHMGRQRCSILSWFWNGFWSFQKKGWKWFPKVLVLQTTSDLNLNQSRVGANAKWVHARRSFRLSLRQRWVICKSKVKPVWLLRCVRYRILWRR